MSKCLLYSGELCNKKTKSKLMHSVQLAANVLRKKRMLTAPLSLIKSPSFTFCLLDHTVTLSNQVLHDTCVTFQFLFIQSDRFAKRRRIKKAITVFQRRQPHDFRLARLVFCPKAESRDLIKQTRDTFWACEVI